MFKKSMTLILIISLIVFSALSASADSRGVFGEPEWLADQDPRLPVLDRISELQGACVTLPDGTYVEVSQGLYEEDRVFLSYLIRTNTDRMILHEGVPDKNYQWIQVIEDWVCGDTDSFGDPDLEKEKGWLDGKSQRWLECPYYDVSCSALPGDGATAEILKGASLRQPDGTTIGWMECRVPEGTDAMTRDFRLNIYCTNAVKFQDRTTFREYWSTHTAFELPFTLYHYRNSERLQGASAAETWQAGAEFSAGKVDLAGTVRLVSKEQAGAWTAFRNGGSTGDVDLILSWVLYQNGQFATDVLSSQDAAGAGDESVYRLAFPRPEDLTGLSLVPVYAQGGEKPGEAIPLETVAMQ